MLLMTVFELAPKMRHKQAVLLKHEQEFTLRNAPRECSADGRLLLDGNYALNNYSNISTRGKEGKAIPLQASRGPEGSRSLRIIYFKIIGT